MTSRRYWCARCRIGFRTSNWSVRTRNTSSWWHASCFFFSSRRRHTRFDCDWSSDVCSSDLSRWEGRQKIELDADDLLAAMADDVLADGDPWRALQRLMHQGVPPGENQRRRGLQDVLKELRKRRQDRLDRYDVGSSLDDIKKKLDD